MTAGGDCRLALTEVTRPAAEQDSHWLQGTLLLVTWSLASVLSEVA